MGGGTHLHVLGPLEFRRDGQWIAPARGHQQRLFAVLAAAPGRAVSVDALAGAVWGDRLPRDPATALQPEVSRLRRALAPAGAVIRFAAGCYTLNVPPDRIDLCRFEELATRGGAALRSGDHPLADDLLSEALALWRGPAFADLAGEPFDSARRRLHEQRLAARVLRAEARLATGHHRELVAELTELADRQPLHEGVAGLLVLALHRSGRPGAAMAAYHRARRCLAEELGQSPGPALTSLYERILGQDPALDWPGARQRPVWNLPPVNPKFSGRAAPLKQLRDLLEPSGAVVLHGLPGIGKTQLALRYAHDQDLRIVWWCPAETPDLLDASLVALAGELGVTVAGDVDRTRIALRRALADRTKWLLIFDNAADLNHLRSWLPDTRTGRIVITSRNADWEGYATPFRVPVFDDDEALRFLLSQVGGDGTNAARLAERLGNLPLALEQAAAFCRRTGDTLGTYLDLLASHGEDLLSRGGTGDYDGTVATTLRLAFARVARDDPHAVELLRTCAFLAADDIPTDVLRVVVDGLGDALALGEAVGTLRRYSLVERHGGGVSMHRLVQRLVRSETTAAQRRALLGRLLDAPSSWEEHTPHLAVLLDHLDAEGLWPESAAAVVCRAARHLDEHGVYASAGRLTNHALRIQERVAGPRGAAGRADLLSEMGRILDRAGCDLHSARPLLREALDILESMPGDTTVAMGRTLSRLAHALHCADLTREAHEAHERALRLLRAAPDRVELGHALAAAGTTLWWSGDLPGAERAFTESIEILIAERGADSPDVAVARSGLGTVLQDLGDLAGARVQLERSVAALRAAHPRAGDTHPEIAQILDKLGYLLRLAGDVPGALDCHERAVRALEELFGADDPRVAMALTNRGLDESAAGDHEQALRTQARAAAIFVEAYGPQHSSTLIARSRHAEALRAVHPESYDAMSD
ncbi:SARP family transcriptional regulator [Actinoplanes lobatus]|uniref:DNA-binding SARP family transcriptional activator n=1 Tax=Actinoplanes lobatus TaxID=113568 RepID=A0A7W7HP37_9ACTN|nr:FxSxx-COOH system tetratricopeptide repeat protein [Actinoplanes lobatus]MBB4754093.1 DNA-binding SARP family transcriptional activator [Actinoplanes lobatus]GGN76857.1 SARP family transcriptional regulator [Actinoplanes lobatus]GIE40851.1 SARP family transcriptional regulator [Actinoplanes lobatus]